MQNGYIESFNGKFRDECLNEHVFVNLNNAHELIETWRQDYNANRPHSSLENRSPEEFATSINRNPRTTITNHELVLRLGEGHNHPKILSSSYLAKPKKEYIVFSLK